MAGKRIITRDHIHQSNLIEGFDSEEADKSSFLAWVWLISHKKVITHEVIQQLNRRITAHQKDLDDTWRGTYRSRSRVKVTVGGSPTAEPALVERLMDNWILDLTPENDPKEMHIRFEKIHPFIDGNGRTGRMLMWWHEKQQGKKATLIKLDDVDEYYSWFK